MKIIEQINAKIKEQYPNCDAVNGIAKQMMFGSDGIKMMVYSKDNVEPIVFVPDDRFKIQVCHNLRGGRKDNNSPFANVINEVDLIVVSKYVKFYHILAILEGLGIQWLSYDLNTRNTLRNDLNTNEAYPEMEAFKIRYNFTSSINELIDFDKLIC
jgi:hypothetical protein